MTMLVQLELKCRCLRDVVCVQIVRVDFVGLDSFRGEGDVAEVRRPLE